MYRVKTMTTTNGYHDVTVLFQNDDGYETVRTWEVGDGEYYPEIAETAFEQLTRLETGNKPNQWTYEPEASDEYNSVFINNTTKEAKTLSIADILQKQAEAEADDTATELTDEDAED